MDARVLLVCCEPDPQLLRACDSVLDGLKEQGARATVRALPGAPGPGRSDGYARTPGSPPAPYPGELAAWELAAAGGIVFATAGSTPALSSAVSDLLVATAPLWSRRQLEDRVVTGFTTAAGPAGADALAGLLRAACHWGSLLLPGPPPGAATPRALHDLGIRMGRLAARAPVPS